MNALLTCENVLLPDPDSGLRIGPATLTIEDGKFADVTDGVHPTAERVQGLLAPAWVNAHTHLSMSCFRGIGGRAAMEGNVVEDLYFRLEGRLTPDAVRAFSTIAAAESLLAGVGTVWDHYYFAEDVAHACAAAGLGAVIAPTLQDLEGPGCNQLDDQLQRTLDIANCASFQAAGIVAALGPHATDTVSASLFARIASLAQAHSLPVHMHAAQSVEEYRRAHLRHQRSPLDWLRRTGVLDAAPTSLLVHVLYANRADLEGLDPTRVALGHCPASQMQYCFPASTTHWREAGHRIVLGTDCGACADGLDPQSELRLLASGPMYGTPTSPAFEHFWEGGDSEAVARHRDERFARSGWADADLLHTVLEGPGTLHPELSVGAIRNGFQADLVEYDLEHPCFWPATDLLRALAWQHTSPAISRMMHRGVWRSGPGDHQRSIREADWYREALTEARSRLA